MRRARKRQKTGKDFTVLVPGAQNELRLCRGGEEVVFSIPWLFPGEDRPTATLALGDVTGDGEEELLYLAVLFRICPWSPAAASLSGHPIPERTSSLPGREGYKR